jgi:DNA-binding CsgD family transcriptional regulator
LILLKSKQIILDSSQPSRFFRLNIPYFHLIFISISCRIEEYLFKAMRGLLMKPLLPREKECLYWIAKGKTSKEIAIILNLKLSTVRNYLRDIRAKLDSATIAESVYKATNENRIRKDRSIGI